MVPCKLDGQGPLGFYFVVVVVAFVWEVVGGVVIVEEVAGLGTASSVGDSFAFEDSSAFVDALAFVDDLAPDLAFVLAFVNDLAFVLALVGLVGLEEK